jgi:hypothetical protein
MKPVVLNHSENVTRTLNYMKPVVLNHSESSMMNAKAIVGRRRPGGVRPARWMSFGLLFILTLLLSFQLLAQTLGPPIRVGIVYSATSANLFYGTGTTAGNQLVYSDLFMSVQHQAMMAGVPYDVLTETDLLNATTLSKYNALILPNFTWVNSTQAAAIANALKNAVTVSHIGLITADELMTLSETGAALSSDPYFYMQSILGLGWNGYRHYPDPPSAAAALATTRAVASSGIDSQVGDPTTAASSETSGQNASVLAQMNLRTDQLMSKSPVAINAVGASAARASVASANSLAAASSAAPPPCLLLAASPVPPATTPHPVMRDYTPGEVILSFTNIYFEEFGTPATAPPAGQTSWPTFDTLATMSFPDDPNPWNAVLALANGGRIVHFANEQIMANGNLLWPALQWVIFGDTTPVGLKLTRNQSLFVSRTDMDQSMYHDQYLVPPDPLDPPVEQPLLSLLGTWKSSYNYVGSYYINIGNNRAGGEYTDWIVAGPLYKQYLALGNEIGTHSYTHPDDTSTLTATQLQSEFQRSKTIIQNNLGITVYGAAVPGNPESLAVDKTLNSWFTYLSGRYANVGAGFTGGFGYLAPDYKMLYFSLNLWPDYTALVWYGWTSDATKVEWQNQYNTLLNHASQPIIHWLWHDYGPTTDLLKLGASSSNLDPTGLYTDTIAYAHDQGTEFATAADVSQRLLSYRTAQVQVANVDANTLTAVVTASDVGKGALRVYDPRVITSVDAWYGYNEKEVFLPTAGGVFTIHLGASPPDPVTRITSLPMRAELKSLTGDGKTVWFTLVGEGQVVLSLPPDSTAAAVSCVPPASDVSFNSSSSSSPATVVLTLASAGTYNVSVSPGTSTSGKPPVQVVFESKGAEDGWVLESRWGSKVGGSVNAAGNGNVALRIGDDANRRQYKFILSFDTSTIPAPAKIISARLELTRGGTSGTDPFQTGSFGTASFDIKKGSFGANGLEASDFQTAADYPGAGTLVNQGSVDRTLYSVVLSSDAINYINTSGTSNTRTQFRFYFTISTDNDRVADYDGFYSGGAAVAARRPHLVITYQPQ